MRTTLLLLSMCVLIAVVYSASSESSNSDSGENRPNRKAPNGRNPRPENSDSNENKPKRTERTKPGHGDKKSSTTQGPSPIPEVVASVENAGGGVGNK